MRTFIYDASGIGYTEYYCIVAINEVEAYRKMKTLPYFRLIDPKMGKFTEVTDIYKVCDITDPTYEG